MKFEEAFVDELGKMASIREKVVPFILEHLGFGIRKGHQAGARGVKKLLEMMVRKSGRDIQSLEKPGLMERAAKGIRETAKKPKGTGMYTLGPASLRQKLLPAPTA